MSYHFDNMRGNIAQEQLCGTANAEVVISDVRQAMSSPDHIADQQEFSLCEQDQMTRSAIV